MRRKSTIPSLLTIIISVACSVHLVASQHQTNLFTTSAKFHAKFVKNDHFSTSERFRYESVTSKLFHEGVSSYYANLGDATHVIVTSVHVARMKKEAEEVDSNAVAAVANAIATNDKDVTTTTAARTTQTYESIVSVTFSEVGLHNAVTIAQMEDSAPNLAALLSSIVTSNNLEKALFAANLLAVEVDAVAEVTFSDFDGSRDERGVASTETDIVSASSLNDGWPMFFAGVMMSLLVVTIFIVCGLIYKREYGHCPFEKPNDVDDDNDEDEKNGRSAGGHRSVHYKGNIDDIEALTTASGVLGLKGHHPNKTNEENVHPNTHHSPHGAYRRKGLSPKTPMSTSSKHPLGITSMRKLDSFLTPQKPKGNRGMYDIERLTMT